MERFLAEWLPRMLPSDCTFAIHAHQGKHAMLRKLEGRLRGYAASMPPQCRIVIVVDRDNDDCLELKSRLEEICRRAGLRSRRAQGNPDWQVVTRIAIEELEAWYFGNWSAVRAAYPRISPNTPRQAAYRNPDAISGGTWEAFERILQKSGYFGQGMAKLKVATDIGREFDPTTSTSSSFWVFWNAISETVLHAQTGAPEGDS